MATILIVDDDENDRVGLAAALRSEGYEILLARDGDEALDLYLARRVHVVVTDMVMPGRDGLSLISAIRDVDPDASIVAVSGKSQSQLEASKIYGAHSMLEKPIDPKALVTAVREAVAARGT
ncbi:MAG: response regulator [Gemmatimonadetes bacterium]|nr:response regulator [Gemmatimonadota bacterium]